MRSVRTEIAIQAPVDVVWRVLIDVPGYNRWNPFLTYLGGAVQKGADLEFKISLPGAWSTKARTRVLTIDPLREFAWLGHFLNTPGLIDGHHRFRLAARGPSETTVSHEEDFRGALLPFLGWFTTTYIRRGMLAMDPRLKREAERLARA
jgi:hypothetical protein